MALAKGVLFFMVVVGLSTPLISAKTVIAGDHVSLGPILAFINKFRGANSLSKLVFDKRLNIAADLHARDLAARNVLSHISSNGWSITQRANGVGYNWRLIAENISAGVPDGIDVVNAWIKSPKHRKNMLLRDIIHAGVGYARSSIKEKGNFDHYWVLVVGSPIYNK